MGDPMSEEETKNLTRRLERERKARKEAESIAERVTSQLYSAVTDLQGTNDQLTKLNQSIRDFVAVASHDLRGPLTSIIGFVQTVRMRWDRLTAEQTLEILELVERQARHLARLVEDLMTISRIEAGALNTHSQVVLLADGVKEVMETFAQRAPEVSISVPDTLAVVADPDHLNRIVTNFVENAIRYGRPPIELSARREDRFVELRVADHGDGIPEDFLPRLFEKFATANSDRRNQTGTGLGLSIVKGLVEANGGAVWYEPNMPEGSCFVVRLPGLARVG